MKKQSIEEFLQGPYWAGLTPVMTNFLEVAKKENIATKVVLYEVETGLLAIKLSGVNSLEVRLSNIGYPNDTTSVNYIDCGGPKSDDVWVDYQPSKYFGPTAAKQPELIPGDEKKIRRPMDSISEDFITFLKTGKFPQSVD